MESKRQRKGGWEGGKKEEREGRKTKSLLFQIVVPPEKRFQKCHCFFYSKFGKNQIVSTYV